MATEIGQEPGVQHLVNQYRRAHGYDPDAGLVRAWERTAYKRAAQRRTQARTVSRAGMRSHTGARSAWARRRVTETRRAARSLQRPLRWVLPATVDDDTLETWRTAVARMQIIP